MKFFWPIYLSSVVLGTVGVYVAAPLARPYLASAMRNDFPAAAPSAAAANDAGAASASGRGGASGEAESPAKEDEEPTPAMLGVYLASYGDRPGWGITNQRTVSYKPDGTRVGNVPGGLIVSAGLARKSTKGLMIECRFQEGGLTNGLYLVMQKDLYLFTGAYTNLSVRQREALRTYYGLNGKIEARKTDLLLASAAKNPHLSEANAAYKAYTANGEKTRELLLQRDRAVNQDRSRIEDELRELKLKEVTLKADLEAANQKFRGWKLEHGGEVAKPDNDADIKKWRQEMADIRPRLPGLVF